MIFFIKEIINQYYIKKYLVSSFYIFINYFEEKMSRFNLSKFLFKEVKNI